MSVTKVKNTPKVQICISIFLKNYSDYSFYEGQNRKKDLKNKYKYKLIATKGRGLL